MKPMKTAAALRASDTEFLQQDSMGKLMHKIISDEIIKPKQTPALDDLVECLRDLTEAVDLWEKSVQDIIGRQPQSGICTQKARALLERIEKGTK